jgi:hypothetical protein
MSAEKNTFKVLLHVSTLKATPPAKSLEQPKSFVSYSQLLQTVLEVFDENLSHFFTTSSNDKPL